MQKLSSLLDKEKIIGEKGGIYLTDISLNEELEISKEAWENIYDFSVKELEDERKDFFRNKLEDHMRAIKRYHDFHASDVYLEIGCGPSYIGEYLMEKYNTYFIGIDFNYKILTSLKKYFDKKGYKKYMLIHADINDMPLQKETVDYIYGGGVIEHFPDTQHILNESYRVLKKKGVSFNTLPGFNFSWILIRLYTNIPAVPILRQCFEFIHLTVLKGRILRKYYGYELSYTKRNLIRLHNKSRFKKVYVGPMYFHPSEKKLRNRFLRSVYFLMVKQMILSPVYYVAGIK